MLAAVDPGVAVVDAGVAVDVAASGDPGVDLGVADVPGGYRPLCRGGVLPGRGAVPLGFPDSGRDPASTPSGPGPAGAGGFQGGCPPMAVSGGGGMGQGRGQGLLLARARGGR